MSPFEHMLEQMAEGRLRDILRRLPRRSRQRVDRNDGFMSPEKAAAVMGVSVAEVRELAGRGYLEIDFEKKLIRPAIVSTLGVEVVS